MLSLVLMSLRRTQCALPGWALFFALMAARAAGADELAGTLPEDYLPTLKPFLEAALKQSPQVIAKEIEISLHEAQAVGVDANRLPSLGGNLNYVQNRTAISGNNGSESRQGGFFYDAALNQPIFHWGELENNSAAARARVLIAEKNYAEAYRVIAVQLRQRYMALIVRKAGLRVARNALGVHKSELALTEDNLSRGLTSKEALASQQLSFEAESIGVERAQAFFDSLRREFARLVGATDIAEDSIPTDIPKPTYSAGAVSELLAGLLRDGAKSTFQAQIHELEMHEADLNYKVAKVRLLPKFNARVEYNLENTTNVTSSTSVLQQGVAQETVALTAQWNIFDGFATRGAKAEAMAYKRLHERELKTTTDQILDRAQWLQRELALDARDLEVKETQQKLVADELSRAQEDLGRGTASKRAIDDIMARLYSQQADTMVARANLLTFWSELVSLAGADPVLNNLSAHYAREKR